MRYIASAAAGILAAATGLYLWWEQPTWWPSKDEAPEPFVIDSPFVTDERPLIHSTCPDYIPEWMSR